MIGGVVKSDLKIALDKIGTAADYCGPVNLNAGEIIMSRRQSKHIKYLINSDSKCYKARNTMSIKAYKKQLRRLR